VSVSFQFEQKSDQNYVKIIQLLTISAEVIKLSSNY